MHFVILLKSSTYCHEISSQEVGNKARLTWTEKRHVEPHGLIKFYSFIGKHKASYKQP